MEISFHKHIIMQSTFIGIIYSNFKAWSQIYLFYVLSQHSACKREKNVPSLNHTLCTDFREIFALNGMVTKEIQAVM